MNWIADLWSRLPSPPGWREIATAPFDREIELAVIGDHVALLNRACLRHGNGWLDAETLRPVTVTATHWRYRTPTTLPMSCC
ncbi:hypothetical protein FXB38_17785 [Bradyrhizobium cytisi]|uniref:Uncharacterized protein n=1 Tax=Bradyrhizobium cytisi TaxID=515489 RepID=A0A5S4WNG7_9BRAD|nr:hypothetical protein FXB38_17785 [Bradyrhizobium cytisi]